MYNIIKRKLLRELPQIDDEFKGGRVINVKRAIMQGPDIYKVITKGKSGKKHYFVHLIKQTESAISYGRSDEEPSCFCS